MTTAHRPTWAPAKGGEDTGGARFFAPSERRMAKDLRSQTKMKYRCVCRRSMWASASRAHRVSARRQDGQASKGELSARDLKLELEAKERAAARKRCVAAARAFAARGRSRGHRRDGGEAEEARALLTAPPGPLEAAPVLVPHAIDADDSDEDASDASGSGSDSDGALSLAP